MMENTDDTQVIKRSVRIAGHPTSISLEGAFWESLKDIAATRGLSLNALIGEVDAAHNAKEGGGGLSTAVRVYVLNWYRHPAEEAPSQRAVPPLKRLQT